jgi:4-hydroxybenzoate polyprenyltransferase
MKNVLLHLRLPFSFFLLPIFLFALSQVPHLDVSRAWWVFFILHFLLFPASNAYNSYYDKDEGSIGLLETPPPVSNALLYTAWGFDLAAILLGILFVTHWFSIYLVAYILVSRAYSYPAIRLKKYPLVSWFTVTIFQGAITYLAVYEALEIKIEDVGGWTLEEVQVIANHKSQITNLLLPALICTSNLLAIYPLTQVYQHDEDARRGDLTMSRILGIRGTFINACGWLGLSGLGYLVYFGLSAQLLLLLLCLAPLLVFFTWWMWQVWQDEQQANFKNTMLLNLLASVCLNIFFGILCFWR